MSFPYVLSGYWQSHLGRDQRQRRVTCLELDTYSGPREMIVLEVLGVVIMPSLRPLGNADAFRSDCYSYCVLHIDLHLSCFLI